MRRPKDKALVSLHEIALSKLLLASIMVADDMDRGLAERGLTRTRAMALWEISQREGTTQRELADVLKVTPRNVTTLVDALETTGFVKRAIHPSDRRATVVALTSQGQAAIARMKREKSEFAKALFHDLERRDLEVLVDALDHIVGRLAETPTA